MKERGLIIVMALVLFSTSAFSQKLIDLDALSKQENKPFLFYLHTDWCIYCAMQSKTLKNKDILSKKNKNYHFIDFDAESDWEVKWKGNIFKNTNPKKYSPHPFVLQLLTEQNIGYPAWVITDKDLNILFVYPGYLKKKQLSQLLDFRQ